MYPFEKLAIGEQMIRVAWLAKTLVALGEGFVNENAP